MGSVDHILDLLRLFTEAGAEDGLRVTDVGHLLEVNKSTASRLLASLREAGFVMLDAESGRYQVGPAAFALGSRFEAAAMARVVSPVLKTLSERTGATASFGIREGARIRFLAVSNHGAPRLQLVIAPGDVQFLHASAQGKAILASLARAERESLVRSLLDPAGLLPSVARGSLTDPARLLENLQLSSERGYAMSNEEGTSGAIGIGAYVTSIRGMDAALSIAFPALDHREAEYEPLSRAVINAAAAASELIRPLRVAPPPVEQTGT